MSSYFYTVPISGEHAAFPFEGYIVPGSDKEDAQRRAEIHAGNDAVELNKSETHRSTTQEIMNSNVIEGREADYVVLEQDRASTGYYG